MSDLKDISHFLNDESANLSDLDWLEVDMEEHEKFKRLPQQNLDAIPDLEEQWKSLSDEDRYRLSPENRRPKHPNTPFWAERDIANDITKEEKASIVESFFRRHLQSGVDAKTALTLLKKNFDSHTLKAAQQQVREVLSDERGLLGNVYVDASLYPDCDQGQGQTEVRKNNKSAKFVIAKDDCKGCVFNKQGTCARFQKDIVFEVNYDAQLWDYYESQAEALGLDLSEVGDGLPEKEKIRKAHLANPKNQPEKLDSKPVQRDPAEDITSEQAGDRLKSAEIKREIVGNVYRDRKVRDIGRRMLAGQHGPDLMDVLDSDPDLGELEKHRYLLGRLYVDLSFFDTRESAESYLNSLDQDPFVYGTPQEEKVSADNSGFSLKHPRVISQLVHRYAVQKHGYTYQSDDKLVGTLEKVSHRLSGFESDKIRTFAQNVYSKPMPEKPKTYTSMAPMVYNPTRGVDSEGALKVLRASEIDREVVEHPYYEKQKRKLARQMMEGDHSTMMETRLADEDFDHLRKHLHLLGRVYVSSQLVGESEFSKLVAENPHLKDLPDVDPDEMDDFFSQQETQKTILSRYARVKQLGSDGDSRDVMSSLVSNVRDMAPDEVRKLAQLAFSNPIPQKTHEYDAYGQRLDPTAGISSEEALSQVHKSEIKRDTVSATEGDRQTFRRVAKRMMRGDHGPAVQAVIEADKAAKPLEKHLHLLGRLYTASFMFESEDEEKAFYRRNSSLTSLPDLDPDDVDAFFTSSEAHTAILRRAALAQGLSPDDHVEKFFHFVESWKEKIDEKSSAQVRKLAQGVFQKPLPASVSEYKGTIFSTKQAKDARASVSDEQVQTFKDVVSERKQEKVGYHLTSSLKQERGRNVLALLNHHFTKDDVRALWFDEVKSSNRVRSVVSKSELEQKAYDLVTADDFEPVNSDHFAITDDVFDTKIGRWLRDMMMEGVTGKRLSAGLRNTFSKKQIVRHAPLILAMREEEGLFGNVFSMTAAFDDCNRGKRELKDSSVKQIVRGSKCGGCIYNGDNRCMLYSKKLVSEPEYTQTELEHALASRRKAGALQDVDVQAIRLKESDVKDKIRLAYRGGEMLGAEVRRDIKPENVAQDHYGGASEYEISKIERKIGEMLKEARQLLVDGTSEDNVRQEVRDKYGRQVVSMGSVYLDRVIERTRDYVSEAVSEENINATTGIEQMNEFEMLSGQTNDPMSNFDYAEEPDHSPMNITFGDYGDE